MKTASALLFATAALAATTTPAFAGERMPMHDVATFEACVARTFAENVSLSSTGNLADPGVVAWAYREGTTGYFGMGVHGARNPNDWVYYNFSAEPRTESSMVLHRATNGSITRTIRFREDMTQAQEQRFDAFRACAATAFGL